MENKQIPALTAKDVECRVQQITGNDIKGYGAILLLYKDARVDMKILDSVYGAMNWQRKHTVINGQLFCSVLIWDESKKQWIEKQDVGTESATEAEKGRASDSFKRACFNVGIGRELYNAPFIYIKLDNSEVKMNSKGKPTTYTRFKVTEMEYNREKECFTKLIVCDDKGRQRYSLNGSKAEAKPNEKPVQQSKVFVRYEGTPDCEVLDNNGKWRKVVELSVKACEVILREPQFARAYKDIKKHMQELAMQQASA